MVRETYIEIRMTEEEKEILENFAKAMGWTFSELKMHLTKEIIRKSEKGAQKDYLSNI
jgi:hypothetical protein